MNQTVDSPTLGAPEAQPRTPWESIDPDEPIAPPPVSVPAIRARARRQQAATPPIVIAQHLFEQAPAVSAADAAAETAVCSSQEEEDEVIERAFFSDAATFDAAEIPAAPSYLGQLSIAEPLSGTAITAPLAITVAPAVLEPRRGEAESLPASIPDATRVVIVAPIAEPAPWEFAGSASADGTIPAETPLPLPVIASAKADPTELSEPPAREDSLAREENSPSPGTPGEGRGEDLSSDEMEDPHPNPLPEYRARGPEPISLWAQLRSSEPRLAAEPQPREEFELVADSDLDPTCATVGGGWTIPLMCLGIGLIACCVIIPQAEANRFLMHEHQSLLINLQSIEKQVSVNNGFLKSVADNPTLAERLASRQMKTIRKGERVLEIEQMPDDTDMSPFALVDVAAPAEIPPYKPISSTIADLCNNARSRLYLMGASMIFVAVGLVLGSTTVARPKPTEL